VYVHVFQLDVPDGPFPVRISLAYATAPRAAQIHQIHQFIRVFDVHHNVQSLKTHENKQLYQTMYALYTGAIFIKICRSRMKLLMYVHVFQL